MVKHNSLISMYKASLAGPTSNRFSTRGARVEEAGYARSNLEDLQTRQFG